MARGNANCASAAYALAQHILRRDYQVRQIMELSQNVPCNEAIYDRVAADDKHLAAVQNPVIKASVISLIFNNQVVELSARAQLKRDRQRISGQNRFKNKQLPDGYVLKMIEARGREPWTHEEVEYMLNLLRSSQADQSRCTSKGLAKSLNSTFHAGKEVRTASSVDNKRYLLRKRSST